MKKEPKPPSKEFEEIQHSGGTYSYTYHEGRGVSQGYSVASSWRWCAQLLCVSFDGEILGYVRPSGMGGPQKPYPQPSIICFLLSDREGFFGARCPSCKSYFRVHHMPGQATCPYCGVQGPGTEFITDNQRKFLYKQCETCIQALNEKRTIEVNIEALFEGLPQNTQGWVYTETKQQSQHKCSRCSYGQFEYDILGDFGVCPSCGYPNFASVILPKLNALEERHKIAEGGPTAVAHTELATGFSDFEALGNAALRFFQNIPATRQRKTAMEKLSFQRLFEAAEKMKQWYGVDLLRGLSQDENEFLNLMLQRRHICIHNGGRVDQHYLEKTSDSTVILNQVVRITNSDILKLTPILRKCANNLIAGFLDVFDLEDSQKPE